MNNRLMRWLILSMIVPCFTALMAFPVRAQVSRGLDKETGTTNPLRLPFGSEPSTQSLESTQRMKEALREQDLRLETDSNRRMFRPKQPEPGYSEIRPYPGAHTPARVDPIRPMP